ncbi:hypothetical protein BpHYR1_037525 [Brachionus plicatilis]|uniref:Uncharacterized protein n=1 Tax=Brachionus plicatilis TaxID=10195 RepID=A0A3M7S038_BRAPC|nr:hypothetical protein BpHYR1_037525 [Brachionus plicatilis]
MQKLIIIVFFNNLKIFSGFQKLPWGSPQKTNFSIRNYIFLAFNFIANFNFTFGTPVRFTLWEYGSYFFQLIIFFILILTAFFQSLILILF